jgi:steroid delta-isomerase-like uncharacterized protein
MKTLILLPVVFTALLLGGCATPQDRVLQDHKEIVQRYFEGWGNRGDPAVADQLIATNVVLRNPPAVINSLEEYKKGMAIFHAAFPDLRFTIEDLVAEADKVVVRWTLHGTHRGEYQGRPATGKTMTISGVSIFRLAEGKIQEIHVNMDRFGMQQQLGWLPAPPPPPK